MKAAEKEETERNAKGEEDASLKSTRDDYATTDAGFWARSKVPL